MDLHVSPLPVLHLWVTSKSFPRCSAHKQGLDRVAQIRLEYYTEESSEGYASLLGDAVRRYLNRR